MPDEPSRTTFAREAPPEGGDADLWRRLSEAASAEEFCAAWLAIQAGLLGGVTAGAVFLRQAGGVPPVPAALWPAEFRDPGRFRHVVGRAVHERRGVVVRSDADEESPATGELRLRLAFPVRLEDRVHSVVALDITPRPQAELAAALRQLQWGAAWLQKWGLEQDAGPGREVRDRLASALEITAAALEEEGFHAAATAFVTELATRLECDRASVGFVRRKQVRVGALSHSAQFGKQMNLIRSIGLAMGEAVDQKAVLVYPEPDGGGAHVLHAHDQLARAHGDRAVLTVPFVTRAGRAFGALTLERCAPQPFDAPAIELCDAVASLAGTVLEEKRRNDRLLITKIGDAAWEQVRRLLGPRHAVYKLVAALLLGLTLFFSFFRADFRVTAKTTLEGQVQRVVTAPFAGFIAEAPVRGGDIVREGDLMARLDDRDLQLEFSRWSHEREQYALEQRRAMAARDMALTNVLTKRINQAEAQIALLTEQIGRTRIAAPFEGLVVSGDLSQQLGAPVETGQVLFEVAPLESYRLMLQVDESDIGYVRPGQTGDLILTAMPGEKLAFTVSKLTPIAVTEEGKSHFLVEAALEGATDRLRPGMEGFGKVRIDRRLLIWIWTHDLWDWLRLWTWSWLP
jgi:multidrug resistance efflux pump